MKLQAVALVLLVNAVLLSCGQTKDEALDRIPGLWVASEISMDQALQGGEMLVEVKDKGQLTVSSLDHKQKDDMTWRYDADIITIEMPDAPIIKAMVQFTNNNMIWDRNGKLLYLVPKK